MRLINADKLIYQSHAQHIQPYINKKDIDNAPTVNAIVIPQNATNGDVIKAMFPSAEIYQSPKMNTIHANIEGETYVEISITCRKDWWNSPYKECEEE